MEKMIVYTKSLIDIVDQCYERFMTGGKPEKGRDFFWQMKQEADPCFEMLDKWIAESTKLVEQRKINTLHQQQIAATKENMESLILHSFYKDTRKRRFMEIYKSCYYIFATVLKEITA